MEQISDKEQHEIARSLAMSHANMVRIGMEHERGKVVEAVCALDAAYRRALDDQQFRAPTTLHVAIEHVLALVKRT